MKSFNSVESDKAESFCSNQSGDEKINIINETEDELDSDNISNSDL